MRDNWCVGYSARYTVGVWVGNFSGAPMWNVSGVSGAAPVWLEIMNYLHRSSLNSVPAMPVGVSARLVAFDDGKGTVRKREYFIAGTEQERVRSSIDEMNHKILYPAPDTVIAIDPDIPSDLQEVYFNLR